MIAYGIDSISSGGVSEAAGLLRDRSGCGLCDAGDVPEPPLARARREASGAARGARATIAGPDSGGRTFDGFVGGDNRVGTISGGRAEVIGGPERRGITRFVK